MPGKRKKRVEDCLKKRDEVKKRPSSSQTAASGYLDFVGFGLPRDYCREFRFVQHAGVRQSTNLQDSV